MEQDDAIVRLARQIDATKRAETFLVNVDAVRAVRRQGACELHHICAEFVSAVNGKLAEARLEMAPAVFAPEAYREPGMNLIQIGSQGREMQVAYHAPAQLVSTEKYLVPYILEGEIRAFNQSMLERSSIRSQLLFYCVENEKGAWRFYDWRTRRTGPLGREFLVSLMEPLF